MISSTSPPATISTRYIMIVPMILKKRWISAALLASFFPLREAKSADMQAPILQPRMIKKQMGSSISPCCAIRRRILTVTEELWMMAVMTVPMITPRIGLVSPPSMAAIWGESFRLAILPDMTDSPMNRTPKPRMTSPIFLIRSFFTNWVRITPRNRNTGAYADRLKETSWEVTVVPMLAPIMTPAAWYRFIIPAFTKLTAITVVALEDWITAQNRIPTRVPMI